MVLRYIKVTPIFNFINYNVKSIFESKSNFTSPNQYCRHVEKEVDGKIPYLPKSVEKFFCKFNLEVGKISVSFPKYG